MERKRLIKTLLTLSSALIMTITFMPVNSLAAKASYLYSLSNFDGTAPFNWVRMNVDGASGEVSVSDPTSQSIVIFNKFGMQIYDFDTSQFGTVADFVVDNEGNFLLLNYQNPSSPATLTKCNYRGDFVSRTEFKGFPPEMAGGFFPNRLFYKNNHLYLASDSKMKVVVTDLNGIFQSGFDLASLIKFDEKKIQSNTGIFGLTVDNGGRILFTMPSLFTVYIVSPDGVLTSFGKRGGSPGKFNIVSGIAEDDKGNIYVTDKLKCAVIVFDRDYNFKAEFGYRGFDRDNLIVPNDLAVDNNGKVYVSQLRGRGVSVFAVNLDQ
jgi:hypothetical protein